MTSNDLARDRTPAVSSSDFRGARFGSFVDLDGEPYAGLFDTLEQYSSRYLAAAARQGVWPADYPWPTDALHCNTRVWEYPFVLDALNRFAPRASRLLDIGSALTFMPSFLAAQGFQVTASDLDRRMAAWYQNMRDALSREPFWPQAGLDYQILDVTTLELAPESFDVVTNISVLEHLPPPLLDSAVQSIHRVLKPNGVLICTLDCWITGPRTDEHHPVDQREFMAFMQILSKGFVPVEPFEARLPSDLISNRHVHRTDSARGQLHGKANRFRNALKALLGRTAPERLEWCVFGITLRKNAD